AAIDPAVRSEPPRRAETRAEPTLKVEGDSSLLFVPMTGTLEGMHDAMWIDPFALVIDLPEATLPFAQTRYALKSGGIKQVTVARPHGVTQLRVYLDALLAHYSVEVVTGGLLLHLKRDLHPLP
ncbi:MAG TPA: AMIN domain-containing protein, partial [Polyangiales bacterium]